MFAGAAPQTQVIFPGFRADDFVAGTDTARWREQLNLRADHLLVGTIARMAPEKGQEVLLEALSLLPESERARIFCVIAGDDSPRRGQAELAAIARRFGVESGVTFPGKLADVRSLMRELDLAVITSLRSEAVCRVALEYMSFGVPVVTSDVNILPEVVRNGVNGAVFPNRNARALADLLRAALRDPALWRARGDAGRVLVHSEFSLAREIQKHDGLLCACKGGAMTDKLPISLVVITLNEAANLARCLRAADFCREIIVVDSGSTDGTLNIAAEFGARILNRAWTGYRDQKNFGTAAAMEPWVLCIDADEVVSPELHRALLDAFHTEPAVDAFEINRHSIYAGRLINHGGWYPQWRLFLYRQGKAEWAGAEPHTTVEFHGTRTARLAGDLYHYTYADIRQHIRKNVSAAYDGAVAMHNRGRRATLADFLLRGPWSFFRGYILLRGFLDGFYGFVIALSAGFYTFLKYAMLHEMNLRHRHQPLPDAVPEAKSRR